MNEPANTDNAADTPTVHEHDQFPPSRDNEPDPKPSTAETEAELVRLGLGAPSEEAEPAENFDGQSPETLVAAIRERLSITIDEPHAAVIEAARLTAVDTSERPITLAAAVALDGGAPGPVCAEVTTVWIRFDQVGAALAGGATGLGGSEWLTSRGAKRRARRMQNGSKNRIGTFVSDKLLDR